MRELRNLSFQILSLLKKHDKAMTLSEICNSLNLEYENVKKAVCLLEKKDFVVKNLLDGKLLISLKINIF